MYALDALLGTVPDALVDDTARKRLRMTGDHLPDGLTATIGLEARLHEDPRVDLLLSATTHRQLGVLAGTDPAVRLPDEFAGRPAWSGAARLARRSLRLLHTGAGRAPALWLEFDVTADGEPPMPAVFAATASAADTGQATGRDVAAVVADIISTAGGDSARGEETRRLAATVRRVVNERLTVRQVGLFPGRPGSGVRLICSPAPDSGRPAEALARCGWPGSRDALARWTRACAAWGARVNVALDATPSGLDAAVGLEVSFAGTPQPSHEPRWGGLLAELEAAGLCTAGKRAAVERLGTSYTADLIPRRRYRQGLHHIKISVAGCGDASTKVYFGSYEVGP